MGYLSAMESCCDECATGSPCASGLGFVVDGDGVVDPSVPNDADGSLDIYASVENLSVIGPNVLAGDWEDASFNGDGLGIVPLVAFGAKTAIPLVTQWIEHMFKFGAGRREADIITPQQNTIWAYIVALSKVALASNDPILLRQSVLNLQQLGANLLRFLSDPRFTDGRASAQAANTIMPYLDGSCGYQPHNLHNPDVPAIDAPGPSSPCMPAGCGGCGNAWPGNFGYGAGLVGALRRMVVDNGGSLPSPNDVTQGVGVPSLQFPGTSGTVNTPPQSGYITSPTGYVGYTTPVQQPQQAGLLGMDMSTLGIAAAVLMGGFFLSRRK